MPDFLLEMKNIDKQFPGVVALSDVSFDLRRGEVHVLLGENGAGKSTLIKILSGYYHKDSGQILLDGKELHLNTPNDAINLGISTIYQEFMLVSKMNVAENIFLGREFYKGPGIIDWPTMYSEASKLISTLGIEINPRAEIMSLGVAQKQMVEIAKAISTEAKILIMDEPTAALTEREITSLFEIVKKLRQDGVGIIYISHRLEEVPIIGDRVTVLRNGQKVGTKDIDEIDNKKMISMMVGQDVKNKFPKIPAAVGDEVLRVENFTRTGFFNNINFSLHKGEILGIAGLVGAGRSELARAIIGADKISDGRLWVEGKEVKIHHPRQAIEQGICYLPEERKEQGLHLQLCVRDNICLPSMERLCKVGVVKKSEESKLINHFVDVLKIRTPSNRQLVKFLSGGNQQKVVVAKWLAAQSKVFIFDEPTRGIDVGAKVEIYNLMNKLVNDGDAILMISSELPEILGMSDRILVMHEGNLVAEFSHEEATQELVLAAAWGQIKQHIA